MQATFLLGAARVEITPPVGTPTSGGGPDGYTPTKSVLDPLYVRALTLRSGWHKLILLQADLIGLSQHKANAIARAVSTRTGVAAENVLVICPQCHNSGCTFNFHSQYPDQITTDFASDEHRLWYESLDNLMATAAEQAVTNQRPVRAGMARGVCRNVTGNRRALMKDGHLRMGWSDPNPAEIEIWGPEDNELIVIRFEAVDSGQPVAALWHFTGHPNSVWMLPILSRDYPGVVEDLLTAREPGMVALFLNGFCGDVDTYRFMNVTKDIYTYPFYKEPGKDLTPNIREMQKLGRILGEEALKLWDLIEIDQQPWSELSIERIRLNCKVRDDTPEFKEHFPSKVELAAVRLGPVALACAPFEPVTALGLQLKKESPAPVTIPVGHAHGMFGYLPDQRTIDEGGYEGGNSWRGYAPGTAEQVVQALLERLKKLFPKPPG